MLRRPGQALRATRKVVTLLFSDVVASTALGEQLDPESLSDVMVRYFDAMRPAVEANGGTVAKFIGDAVMAVFGIPATLEDDALRAVRAASAMQLALAVLNADLMPAYGVALRTRTGLNTGEVLVNDPCAAQNFVLGDAVNMAARLERAAAPGEILLGASTYRLVRRSVAAEPVDPVAAKGKAQPIDAYRLLDVTAAAVGVPRRFDVAMVGRAAELSLLDTTYRKAVEDRSCRLVTILGSPGIGKSRLVAELADATRGAAAVLVGRCLSYGNSITFWPIGEIVAQAAAVTTADSVDVAKTKLRAVVDGEDHADVVTTCVAELIGLEPATTGIADTFWGLRVFLEALARRRPLVVVLDDVQWAQPTLLDLMEHVVDWSRDAPILLVCAARPELVDVRPTWGLARDNATSVILEPLAEAEAMDLLERLLGQTTVLPAVAARIMVAAQGNPLFVEEMFAMLVDEGSLGTGSEAGPETEGQCSAVPSTIAAVLAARLDRLSADERHVLACASVVGQVFWRSAVAELGRRELEHHLTGSLAALMRRGLIVPERSSFSGDDAFRFHHLLVRDAAYLALPKSDRAGLHEAFANWLERVAGERVGEYEAILGHHLEQSCRLRDELCLADELDAERARRGATWLARAGRRSWDLGDDHASAGLLGRAADLLPAADVQRAQVLADLGCALRRGGQLGRADVVLSEAVHATARHEDRCLHGRAVLERMIARIHTGASLAPAEQLATAWVPEFTDAGDDHGLALAHWTLGLIQMVTGRAQDANRSFELAWRHGQRAGETRLALDAAGSQRVAINIGPTPATEALRLFEEHAPAVTTPFHLARLEVAKAWALAMRGAFAASRARLSSGRSLYRQLGLPLEDAGTVQILYLTEVMAGDASAATEDLLATVQILEDLGETNLLGTIAGMSADALVTQDRCVDAERLSRRAEELADPQDVDAQTRWRRARARVLARRGETLVAERFARAAVELVAGTDALNDQADTLLDLAEVLRLAGRLEEASTSVRQAVLLYRRKGNVAMAARSRLLIGAGPEV